MYQDERILPLVDAFKKIASCPSDQLLALFTEYDFKEAMITFFRDCNPSAKKDLVTKQIEMEAGDFVKLWRLFILKANDGAIFSKTTVDALQNLQACLTASKSDKEQRLGALIGPLIGVIESITDELRPDQLFTAKAAAGL